MKENRYKNDTRTGQVLLIVVMLLATVVTVVMTVAFNSTSVSQITKLEEDSQNALAAAEAGIEAAIKMDAGRTVNIASIGNQFSGQGISGQAEVTTAKKPYFVTPLMQKDEQYTFYLSDYPGFANPYISGLNVYFVSESGGCPAVEITVVKADNTYERYAYNSCASVLLNASTGIIANNTVDGSLFSWITPTLTIPVSKIMLVKVYSSDTKIGFRSADGTTLLPLQGKTVDSEARTQTGVTKRVVLFQSYPQIPASFFETSF